MTFEPGTPPPAAVGDTADDHVLATWLAETAGRRLLEVRAEGLEGKELKDAGDAAAHELLMDLLAQHRPDDAVLSEEGKDDKARLDGGAGVDHRPARRHPRVLRAAARRLGRARRAVAGRHPGRRCRARSPSSARRSTPVQPPVVPPRTSQAPRIAVSRSRPPAFVQALAEEIGAELVPMGSAGVKMMSVVRDVADAYVHAGGQYEWDSAAPVAVARAAGLFTSRVDGSELVYNQDDVYLPDLVVCRPELSEQILAFIAAHGTD